MGSSARLAVLLGLGLVCTACTCLGLKKKLSDNTPMRMLEFTSP